MNHSQIDHLIKMINQIAANIPRGSDAQQTAASIASHVTRFWTPKMIRHVCDHVATQGDDLNPLAREAVALLEKRA
ncbi:MAG: formate dehydrogenase subunit delta [Porticoccaceae bacterium]